MKFSFEGIFGGKKEEKSTDSAGHIANPEINTGELAGEDQEHINFAAQLARLDEEIKRANEAMDRGDAPDKPLAELIERREILEAQAPFGKER